MEVRVRNYYLLVAAMLFMAKSSAVSSPVHRSNDRQASVVAQARNPHLPLLFEANLGQASAEADFIAHGPGYNLFLSPKRMTLALEDGGAFKGGQNAVHDAIAIEMLDSDQHCQPRGAEELSSKINYILGKDPANWQIGVRTYGKVKYENLYAGIDLVFYGTAEHIEYDFIVHPGADTSKIRFSLKSEGSAVIEEDGALALATKAGTIRFRAPLVYQEAASGKQSRQGHFLLAKPQGSGERIVSFEVASYDHSKPLIIDPVLDYSTYLGGSAYDWAGAVAVDNAGNAYIAGTTSSLDFPVTPGVVFPTHGGCSGSCYDAFIAKINTTGGGLIYATYLGGTGDDFANAIAIDGAGNAYVTGATNSTDFPTTDGALQRSCGGTCFRNDGFVAKLNATGSALLYSTYLGGSDEDAGTGIAVRNGKTYVSGFSSSTDFPTTSGAYQKTMQGQGSSFVAELNSNATALVFSTFLGEVDLFDAGGALAVDAAGNSHVAGTTLSANFPLTAGAFHTTFQSGLSSNMYILKLNPTGSAVVYSVQIGGAAPAGIALDAAGNTYVAGSAGLFSPVTPGAVDQSCDNGALILKLSPTGGALLTAAHICPDRLWPAGVSFDSSNNIIFSGYTDSPSLPTTVGSMRARIANTCCFSDAVLGKLKADGSALVYMTYFGGNNSDNTNGLATDLSGNIYLAGGTSSTNLPLQNAFQTADAGSIDAFLAKITLPQPKISVSPATLTFASEGIGNTSPALQVTVANLGTASIPVSGVVASGDFSATSGCGAAIPAGYHCSISLEFKPAAAGSRTGKLTITDGLGVQNVALAGTGVSGPLLSFSTAYQIFTAANTISPPFPVTVTNVGNAALTISGIQLTNGPAFNFGSITCGGSLAPLASCIVNVTFSGQPLGQSYSTLSFTDNAGGSPQSIGLAGSVVGQGLAFTAPGLRFGQQAVGSKSAPLKATLINGTGAALTVTSIKASANFSQSNTCGTSLAAGAYCYVTVSFKPASIGIKQGSITVVDSASGSPQVLPLIGTGN
jgi:Beta-propeller repeat